MEPFLPLIQQLNSTLTRERYLALLPTMVQHGYRMVCVWENKNTLGDPNACIGLSGIWTGAKLYSGSYLEMDNVVIDSTWRGKQVGAQLLNFIEALALEEGIEMIMLDAYRENIPAHRFYEKHGFIKRGFHFLKPIQGWSLENPPRLPEELQ